VVPFGLSGAPGTFQGAMNGTLSPLLRKCVIVFFDDILVYSSSYEDHLSHLQQVLTLLAKDHWVVKLKKCHFAKQEIHYFGHVLKDGGVHTDPAKVTAVQEWPQPSNVRELRGFLGLVGFYKKFVRNFAVIAKPLTNLLKKHTIYVWTSEHQLSFDTLKQALCSAPVLGIPDFPKSSLLKLTHVKQVSELYFCRMAIHSLMLVSRWAPRIKVFQHMKKSIWPY